MSIHPIVTSNYAGFQFEFRGRRKEDNPARNFMKRCRDHYEDQYTKNDVTRECTYQYFLSVYGK